MKLFILSGIKENTDILQPGYDSDMIGHTVGKRIKITCKWAHESF